MSVLLKSFYNNVSGNPDKIAVFCDGEQITYKGLGHKVKCYAKLMKEQGIDYGDHIGFPMNNSIESVSVMMAAATIGAAIVPFNASMPLEDIKNIFKVAKVKHLVARSNFIIRNRLNVNGEIICIDSEIEGCSTFLNADKELDEFVELSGDERFIITMTSGSTGNPKPITLTQNDKLNRAIAHIELYNIKNIDIILTATPLYHSLAERLVLIPLFLGGTSVILSRFSPKKWLEYIAFYNVTFTIAVSAQLAQVSKLLSSSTSFKKLNSLRAIVSSSALLEPIVRENLINVLQCEFYEMYGASEVSTVTSINFKQSLKKQNSVGYPLKEAEIIILDDRGKKCLPNQIGEIACKTKLICSGYFNKEELFNKNLYLGYFKTGDLGYLDEDGFLYFSGRKKEVIITGGINVYPPDIERVVTKISDIKECAAFSYPDENLGECVALAIVGDEKLKRKVQITCARHLSDYQQPMKIFFVNQLPKNSMGKVMKHKLLDFVGGE